MLQGNEQLSVCLCARDGSAPISQSLSQPSAALCEKVVKLKGISIDSQVFLNAGDPASAVCRG